MSDETTEIVAAAEEAMKPGKFNILDVLKSRSYPEAEVNVYVDEATAYEASKVSEQLNSLDKTDKKLEEKFNALIKKIEDSKYVFTISGISEGKREELYKIAAEKYPIEYKEDKNVLTGETKREEISNEDRDSLLTNLIWAECVTKIVAPDGSVQDSLTVEDAKELREFLPIASNSIINDTIQKMRAATAVFLYKVDEDFLAKS
jgi:hypothetical protein